MAKKKTSPPPQPKRPKPPAEKSNTPTTARTIAPKDAVEQVALWMIEGNGIADISEAIKAAYPKSDVKKLIAAALDRFEETGSADLAVLRGWCLESYRELYRRMVEIGDYSNALKAIKEIYKISSE